MTEFLLGLGTAAAVIGALLGFLKWRSTRSLLLALVWHHDFRFPPLPDREEEHPHLLGDAGAVSD